MSLHQKMVAALFAISLLVVIVELVRRRRLKEEYSWLWIIAGVVGLVLGLNYGLLQAVTTAIGAGFTSSALFFLGIFFLVTLCLQFSVKISRLETQVKNLAQELALLNARRPARQTRPPR
jgi:hypothetical protein